MGHVSDTTVSIFSIFKSSLLTRKNKNRRCRTTRIPRMNTSPSRQPKNTSQPQRLPYHKKEHSQTTIDLYLKPVKKDGRGQNDIRNYFLPIAKARIIPNGESKKADSREEMRATSMTGHDGNSGNEFQMSGPRPDVKTPVGNKTSIPISPQPSRETPAIPVRPRTHKYANSEVLPKFGAFFDSKDFPHSTSPMAPRVTDVAHHSLVPKPLNIRLPPPPVEASRSPSVTTSSPSSVEDSDDAASLDEEADGEERRGAPSFKQTYSRVHSRHNTNDEPISPLVALRGPSSKRPLRQRMERPKTLRSKTVPLFSEGGYADGDSVIYFLPKISPTEESSADEGTPLGMSGWVSSVQKDKTEGLDR